MRSAAENFGRRVFLSAGLAILCLTGLSAAQSIRLDVFVGNVDIDRHGSGEFIPARTGMMLDGRSVVRTGPASYVRILQGNKELVMRQNMMMSVSELTRQSAAVARDSYFSFMSGLLKGDPAGNVTIVAAVRHVREGQPVSGRDSANARAMYERGEYQQVIDSFKVNPPANDGMKYILASSCFRTGDYARAADEYAPLYDGRYAGEAMYYGALSLQAMNRHEEAAAVLDRFLENIKTDIRRPDALALRGVVAESLHRPAEASGYYRRLLRESGEGAVADYARERLRQLESPRSGAAEIPAPGRG